MLSDGASEVLGVCQVPRTIAVLVTSEAPLVPRVKPTSLKPLTRESVKSSQATERSKINWHPAISGAT